MSYVEVPTHLWRNDYYESSIYHDFPSDNYNCVAPDGSITSIILNMHCIVMEYPDLELYFQYRSKKFKFVFIQEFDDVEFYLCESDGLQPGHATIYIRNDAGTLYTTGVVLSSVVEFPVYDYFPEFSGAIASIKLELPGLVLPEYPLNDMAFDDALLAVYVENPEPTIFWTNTTLTDEV